MSPIDTIATVDTALAVLALLVVAARVTLFLPRSTKGPRRLA